MLSRLPCGMLPKTSPILVLCATIWCFLFLHSPCPHCSYLTRLLNSKRILALVHDLRRWLVPSFVSRWRLRGYLSLPLLVHWMLRYCHALCLWVSKKTSFQRPLHATYIHLEIEFFSPRSISIIFWRLWKSICQEIIDLDLGIRFFNPSMMSISFWRFQKIILPEIYRSRSRNRVLQSDFIFDRFLAIFKNRFARNLSFPILISRCYINFKLFS